jgi:formate/nitrite transporter FocA (FNT family)
MNDIWMAFFFGNFCGATIAFFYLEVLPFYKERKR